MTGFDRGIADDGGLDPEEVLKLFLILAAVMDQGRITGSSDRRGAEHKGQGRRDRRHRREDRRGFLSRGWKLNRKSSARKIIFLLWGWCFIYQFLKARGNFFSGFCIRKFLKTSNYLFSEFFSSTYPIYNQICYE